MFYKIENDFLTCEIDDMGAQLHSLKLKGNGKEYIWQGNPDIWYGQAPVLFPVIGQLINDKYFYNGVEYTCSPIVGDATWYMGNLSLIDESIPNTGEPFIIGCEEGTLFALPFDGAESVTMSIFGAEIVKIPDKYINGTPIIERAVEQATEQANTYTDHKAIQIQYDNNDIIDLTTIYEEPFTLGKTTLKKFGHEDTFMEALQRVSVTTARKRVRFKVDGSSNVYTTTPLQGCADENGNETYIAFVPDAPAGEGVQSKLRVLNISTRITSTGYNVWIQVKQYT